MLKVEYRSILAPEMSSFFALRESRGLMKVKIANYLDGWTNISYQSGSVKRS